MHKTAANYVDEKWFCFMLFCCNESGLIELKFNCSFVLGEACERAKWIWNCVIIFNCCKTWFNFMHDFWENFRNFWAVQNASEGKKRNEDQNRLSSFVRNSLNKRENAIKVYCTILSPSVTRSSFFCALWILSIEMNDATAWIQHKESWKFFSLVIPFKWKMLAAR